MGGGGGVLRTVVGVGAMISDTACVRVRRSKKLKWRTDMSSKGPATRKS